MFKVEKNTSRTLKHFVLAFLVLVGALPILAADNPGDEVIVVYNTHVPESKSLAYYYAEKRQVPKKQIFGFALSTSEEMSRREFTDQLEKPLAKQLEKKKLWHIASDILPEPNGQPPSVLWHVKWSKIRYAVLCYGVPVKIARDNSLIDPGKEKARPQFRRNEAAVDSELAALPTIDQDLPLDGPLTNPLRGTTNAAALTPTNGVLMVARLDGPTAEIARGLVDKAIQAETNGLWGRAYFDIRNIQQVAYKVGDDWMRDAAEMCRATGFETYVDTNAATFKPEFPMSQIAIYCGWYDANVSGPFTRNNVEFMPGAFAYHIHSYSAANLRSVSHNWAGPLLAKGATATMGCVYEPYLGGTPDIALFISRFIHAGFTFGEAAYASQSCLSWQVTVVGDPLYRPFGKPPMELFRDLAARNSDFLPWFYLRVADLNIVKGTPLPEVAGYLEHLAPTRTSPILTEKLADVYDDLGKTTTAIDTYEKALTLHPSPEQAVRIRLTLADKMLAQKDDAGAYNDLKQMLEENPDYPAKETVYKRLEPIAARVRKQDDLADLGKKLNIPPPAEAAKP